ncbi:MAG: beta,4-xylanase [Acidimicrobiales bacterium]|jgi:endo-1,4-beta-xylanase|nr:beta,4-xylanase [Acidimicrobiales bacterium]
MARRGPVVIAPRDRRHSPVVWSVSVVVVIVVLAAVPARTVARTFALRPLADRARVHLGAAVAAGPLRFDAAYRRLLAENVNTITPEDAMKFGPIHPEPHRYDFADADLIVAFAANHGMKVRGHNLVWQSHQPDWINRGTWTRAGLLAVLHDHIATVVGRYRHLDPGVVIQWDVVNEAIAADGTRRPTIWQRVIGDDYIDWAFRFAHEADPSAALFYNDDLDGAAGAPGTAGGPTALDRGAAGATSDCSQVPKCRGIRALVAGLVARHVPISGVGFQAHLATQAPADYRRLTGWVRPLGLRWAATELDVPVPSDAHPAAAAVDDRHQTQAYRDVVDACMASPVCDTVVTWGITDRYSWWNSRKHGLISRALPFDAAYRPKPAAYAVARGLAERTSSVP